MYGVPKFWGCSPSSDPRQFWYKKMVLACYGPNTSCITNFKLLASVAAAISRGSQNLAVPNVEEPHIYRGKVKNFVNELN